MLVKVVKSLVAKLFPISLFFGVCIDFCFFHFFFSPLFSPVFPFFFLLKNQMGLTLKNCGTADDLHNTQKKSQQSHPARICLLMRHTILITSILDRVSCALFSGWSVAQAVILTFRPGSRPCYHMTPSKSHLFPWR